MTADPRHSSSLGVLVAEDSEFDRMLLREAFEELDFDVSLTFVDNGEALFDHLRSCRARTTPGQPAMPALILMDLNMPRMKGLDALRNLRADNVLRTLPVIVLSTSSNPRQIAQAYASGVNAYMIKPERFADLLDMIKRFGEFWLRTSKLPDPAVLV